MKPYRIFVVVQPGLEDIAEREIRALGYDDYSRIKGGIFLTGHLSTVMKINFACRCISRVLIEIADFEARSFSQLEHQFSLINWQDYISNQNVSIRVSSYQSELYHEKAISERLINTLSDVFRKTINVVSSPDEDNTQLIIVYAKHDKFTVRMDTSGAHLHKRGYGIYKEDAPLRETLACAMLFTVGWPEQYNHLHDPMCGSGTIAIEAALIATKMPWCEFREFAFQKWSIFKQEIYDKTRTELLSKANKNQEITIIASDIDGKAIDSAKLNAEKANVTDLISFNLARLTENSVDKNCIVVTNPPWGKRMETGADSIQTIWHALSNVSRRSQGAYLILPETQEREFSLTYKTLLKFEAGGIKVKFIKLED